MVLTPGMLIVLISACCAMIFAAMSAVGQEQSGTTAPKTNAEVMHMLVAGMVDRVLPNLSLHPGDSVALNIKPGQDEWLVEGGVAAALRRAGVSPYRQTDTTRNYSLILESRTPELTVRYLDGYREGLFGTKKVKRSILAGFSLQATEPGSHRIVFSDMLRQQYADTVTTENVPSLESSSMQSTHGELPGENALDRVVEPFVIIGATAVAVYLFFHIRS